MRCFLALTFLAAACSGPDSASTETVAALPRFADPDISGGPALGGAGAAAGSSSAGASSALSPSEGATHNMVGIDTTAAAGAASAPASSGGGAGAPTSSGGGAGGTGANAGSPVASPGCGTAAPPEGQSSLRVGGVDALYTVTLPNTYDPNTPVPLVFGFHGRGRTHLEFQQVDASQIQSEIGSRAVMAYLKSQAGTGWNFPEEVEPNVEFFETLYPQLLSNYCIDISRIFAIGHSSGGYFSNILACRFGDRLRGIASIAGATQETGCVGRVAAMIVHGVRDSVVSFASGQQSRNTYLATNGCSTTTSPAPVAPCLAYRGCAEGLPVRWCEHDEPTYENTNHGWPSFASRAVGEFLFSLP